MKWILYVSLVLVLLQVACKKSDYNKGQSIVSVKNFWPNSGNAGTIVTINGTGLNKLNDDGVTFNGTKAQIMDRRDSVVKVLAPTGATSGAIETQADGNKVTVGNYTFQNLSLGGISPANGPAGTNVTIKGSGFSSVNGPAKVFVNGKEAVITAVADSQLVAAVPVAAGSGEVKVVVDNKEVVGPGFIFQNISGIKPLRGGKGTKVTISGEGFSKDPKQNLVLFNGKDANVLSASDSSIVVEAPNEVTTGPVSVTINGQQTVGNTFTVVPAPVLTSVAPLSGPVGTDVTIKGEFFSNFKDEITITFNGTPAVVTSATDKMMVVKVPANATKGPVEILINGQTAQVPDFKVQNLGIVSVTPDNGMDGDLVTIKGIGFSQTMNANTVMFNGISALVTQASETELTVKVPANFTSGYLTVQVGGLSATGPFFSRAGVITLAGGDPNAPEFANMNGIAVDSKGNVFVALFYAIKKITPSGQVSTLAGNGTPGLVDGTGDNARFNYLSGLAVDENDNIYASDQFNNRIRKITQSGVVTTVGTPPNSPLTIATDPTGNLYVGQSYNGVFLFNKNTGTFTKALNAMYETAAFIAPISGNNFYYAADWDYYTLFRVLNGAKTSYINPSNSFGFADGSYADARFNNFSGVTISKDGNTIYILNGASLRRAKDGVVTTLIGMEGANGFPPVGYVDGGFAKALFRAPKNLCIDKDGNVYIADVGNRAIRKVFFK